MTEPRLAETPVAPAAEPAAPRPVPRPSGAGARRWQAIVFASQEGGQTRRRASDAVRILGATLVFLVTVAALRLGPVAEVRLAHLLDSSPLGIKWVVTFLWVASALAVIALVVVWGAFTKRIALLRDVATSGVLAWLVCVGAGALLGSTGGRPATAGLGSIDPGFPSVRIAVTVAVSLGALAYLSRGLRRLTVGLLVLAVASGLVAGAVMPLDALASLAIAYGAVAATRLAYGTPLGLPSVAAVADALADLGMDSTSIEPVRPQLWGVARYRAHCPGGGGDVEVSVYGRDASDAQALAKAWHFLVYRDSGPTLVLTRLQQVEHEAYLTMRAGQVGVRVPAVRATGYGGPSHDALLVTDPPPGRTMAELDADTVTDDTVAGVFAALDALRAARMAHGALSPGTVVVAPDGSVALRDFRCASS
ncbi:MAG TPA: hypothetical protein VEI83_01000, partial [Acidimicrobiales bacterium]|nr:hypothetical protein [Acidimicrobiales bacterium]